jgi:hypothetical protein
MGWLSDILNKQSAKMDAPNAQANAGKLPQGNQDAGIDMAAEARKSAARMKPPTPTAAAPMPLKKKKPLTPADQIGKQMLDQ